MENIQEFFDLQMVLLRPTDVARMLNISRSLAYRLLQTGAIPVVHINSAVRVKLQDLEAYVEQQRSSETNRFDWELD